MSKKARYIGNAVFRFGDRRLVKGELIDGPEALVNALLERGDFEADTQADPGPEKIDTEENEEPEQ